MGVLSDRDQILVEEESLAVPKSVIEAAGDLIYGSADDTPTRLPAGSDGQVLTLASGLPSWAAGASAPLTLTSTATSMIPLTVKGAAGQTANLQEWQDSAGTVLSRVKSDGSVYAVDRVSFRSNVAVKTHTITAYYGLTYNTHDGGGHYFTSTSQTEPIMRITNSAAAQQVLLVRGAAAQTANLQEWQDSTGVAETYITSNRDLRLTGTYPNGATTRGLLLGGATPGWDPGKFVRSGDGATLQVGRDGYGYGFDLYSVASVGLRIRNNSGQAAHVPLVVQGAVSQTANLQEWQNSAGAVLASVSAAGFGIFSNGMKSPSLEGTDASSLTLGSPTGANYPVLIQAQNVTVGTFRAIPSAGEAHFMVNTIQTDKPSVIVKAVAAQSANLQEWQDSAGTVLASVTAAGLHKWASGNEQTSVGAAGAASALPASPTKYLKVVGSDGTTYVVPAFLAA